MIPWLDSALLDLLAAGWPLYDRFVDWPRFGAGCDATRAAPITNRTPLSDVP
jgi:hypothetical protein